MMRFSESTSLWKNGIGSPLAFLVSGMPKFSSRFPAKQITYAMIFAIGRFDSVVADGMG